MSKVSLLKSLLEETTDNSINEINYLLSKTDIVIIYSFKKDELKQVLMFAAYEPSFVFDMITKFIVLPCQLD